MKLWTIGLLAAGAVLLPVGAMAMNTPPAPPPSAPGSSSSGGASPVQVPEPASMLVLGGGLGALSIARKFGRPKR